MKNYKAGKEREEEKQRRGRLKGKWMMKLENENEREMKTHNHRAWLMSCNPYVFMGISPPVCLFLCILTERKSETCLGGLDCTVSWLTGRNESFFRPHRNNFKLNRICICKVHGVLHYVLINLIIKSFRSLNNYWLERTLGASLKDSCDFSRCDWTPGRLCPVANFGRINTKLHRADKD